MNEESAFSWVMVGAGNPRDIFCGKYNSRSVQCPTQQEGHLNEQFKFSCKRVICPECYGSKISQQAHNAVERFGNVRKAYYLAGHALDFGELIVSPPKELYYLLKDAHGLDVYRKMVQDYAVKCGMVGGLTVIHRIRGRRPYIEAVREHKTDAPDSWHTHIIGFSLVRVIDGELNPDVMSSRDFNAWTANPGDSPTPNGGYSSGWTYKWVSEFTKKGERRNMYKKIRYELDHAELNVKNGKPGQVGSWWGICSRHAVHQLKTQEHQPWLCEVCNRQGHLFVEDEDHGEALRKVTLLQHEVRDETMNVMRTRYRLPQGPRRYETLEGVIHYEVRDLRPGVS